MMKKIAKEKLELLLDLIAKNQELYIASQLDRPPKHVFFPQSETLYTARRDQGKLSIEPEKLKDQDFVLFGVKACDVRGFEILDKVYLADPVDSYYAERRKHGTVVTLACHEPEETCFCQAFAIDPVNPEGDVVIWEADQELFWKPLTTKGENLTKIVDTLLEKADAKEVEQLEVQKQSIKELIKRLPYADLSLEGWPGATLEEKFDSDLWEELHKTCLACGTCTYLCPTCQCYDIKDHTAGCTVRRYRCWDSCMYSDFTMMSHGNNRTTQMQRFRQRFMHKLVYFPENHEGTYSCVGCGQCVAKCPSALNIVKVIKAFEARRQK
jgi:ferredoxin